MPHYAKAQARAALGAISRQNMERVDEAIKISLGLIEF
jgi:hypothetical protein